MNFDIIDNKVHLSTKRGYIGWISFENNEVSASWDEIRGKNGLHILMDKALLKEVREAWKKFMPG